MKKGFSLMLVTVMLVAFGCSKENLVPDNVQANGQKGKVLFDRTGDIEYGLIGYGADLNLGDQLEIDLTADFPNYGVLNDELEDEAECSEFLLVGEPFEMTSIDEDPAWMPLVGGGMQSFTFYLGGQHISNCVANTLCNQGTFQGATVNLYCVSGGYCEGATPGVPYLSWDLTNGQELDLGAIGLGQSQYQLEIITHWSDDGALCASQNSGTLNYTPYAGITGGNSGYAVDDDNWGGTTAAAFIDP